MPDYTAQIVFEEGRDDPNLEYIMWLKKKRSQECTK